MLDIDYRPVLWGLTTPGDGETRFIADDKVTTDLQAWLSDFDLIVGTEEEFHIAGGSTDTLASLRAVRELSEATLVCKLGALGCVVFEGEIPERIEDGILVEGVEVEVLNVLGAGDAFMSGLLRGWLRGASWETSASYANACGALVVSRHGCAPAMPTEEELFDYLAVATRCLGPTRTNASTTCIGSLPARSSIGPRSVAWPSIIAASSLTWPATSRPTRHASRCSSSCWCGPPRRARGVPGSTSRRSWSMTSSARTPQRRHWQGWWIGRPVELPSSRPLRFQHGDDLGSRLRHWPREHIIKCLVFYHPDDPMSLRLEQETRLRQLYQAACANGLELLIEVIPPAGMAVDDTTLPRSLQRLYNLGIRPDWWKLPAMSDTAWDAVSRAIDDKDPYCRGVVLLGLDARWTT